MSDSTLQLTVSAHTKELNTLQTQLMGLTDQVEALTKTQVASGAATDNQEKKFKLLGATLLQISRHKDELSASITRLDKKTLKHQASIEKLTAAERASAAQSQASAAVIQMQNQAFAERVKIQSAIAGSQNSHLQLLRQETVATANLAASQGILTRSQVENIAIANGLAVAYKAQKVDKVAVVKATEAEVVATVKLTNAYTGLASVQQTAIAANKAITAERARQAATTDAVRLKTDQLFASEVRKSQAQLNAAVRLGMLTAEEAKSLGLKTQLVKATNAQTTATTAATAATQAKTTATTAGTAATAAHTKATRGLTAAQMELHGAMRGTAGAAGSLWLTYGSMVPLLAAFATVGATLKSFRMGSEFDTEMRFIQGLTRQTTERMSELNESVLELARTTIYTPTQIVQGLRILAQAGFSIEQSMVAVNDVMRLARIGEMEVAEAANVAQTAMYAFGKTANDVGHIVNNLAQAATMSATNIKEMSAALTTGSEVGSLYGVTLEETTAALTVLAQRHIVGQAAGTAFKNMMRDIGGVTQDAKEMVKGLGIETHEATGEMRPMVTVLQDIKRAMDEFSPDVRQAMMRQWMTRRGIRAFVPMIEQADSFLVESYMMMLRASEDMPVSELIEKQLTEAFSGESLRAVSKFETTLIEAFQQVEQGAVSLIHKFGELWRTDEARNFISTVVSGSVAFGNFLVDHFHQIVKLTKAYVAYRVAVLAASMANAAFASTSKVGLVALAALAKPLGIFVGVVVGATAAYALFRKELGTELTVTDMFKRALVEIKLFKEAIDQINPEVVIDGQKQKPRSFLGWLFSTEASQRELEIFKGAIDAWREQLSPEPDAESDNFFARLAARRKELQEEAGIGEFKKPQEQPALRNLEVDNARHMLGLYARQAQVLEDIRDMDSEGVRSHMDKLQEESRALALMDEQAARLNSMKETRQGMKEGIEAQYKIVLDYEKKLQESQPSEERAKKIAELEQQRAHRLRVILDHHDRMIDGERKFQDEMASTVGLGEEFRDGLVQAQTAVSAMAEAGSVDQLIGHWEEFSWGISQANSELEETEKVSGRTFPAMRERVQEVSKDLQEMFKQLADPNSKLHQMSATEYLNAVGFADPEFYDAELKKIEQRVLITSKTFGEGSKQALLLAELLGNNLKRAQEEATGVSYMNGLRDQYNAIGLVGEELAVYNDKLMLANKAETLQIENKEEWIKSALVELGIIRSGNQERERANRLAQEDLALQQQKQALGMTVSTAGMGTGRAGLLQQQLQISQRAAQDIMKLRQQGGSDQEIKDAQELAKQRVAFAQEAYDKQLELSRDWRAGTSRALKDYATDAQNVYERVGSLAVDAFKKMEDGIIDFVRTGRFEFGNFVQDILEGLLRIQMQQMIIGPLAGAIGGMFSGGGGAAGASAQLDTMMTTSGLYHSGGVVGSTSAPTRQVPSSMFDHAPRFHNGLASDEFPAILQRGEEVIPRNRVGNSDQPQEIKVEIFNESGQQVKAKQATAKFDFKRMVIGVVLEGLDDNTMGLRRAMGGA